MYTVCPKCALTLVVTAADLRVAQGFVRCGRCSNVFNALARLSDERQSSTQSQPAPEPPPGSSAISDTSATSRNKPLQDGSVTGRTRLMPDPSPTGRTRTAAEAAVTGRMRIPADTSATGRMRAATDPSTTGRIRAPTDTSAAGPTRKAMDPGATGQTRVPVDSSLTGRSPLPKDPSPTARSRSISGTSTTRQLLEPEGAPGQRSQDPASTSSAHQPTGSPSFAPPSFAPPSFAPPSSAATVTPSAADAQPSNHLSQTRAEDDGISDDSLEFNPDADLSSVFVEQEPSAEFKAATGTFKSLRLEAEEAARTQVKGDEAPFDPVDSQVDVEIDPDVLAAMAHMSSNRLEKLELPAADTPSSEASRHDAPHRPPAPAGSTPLDATGSRVAPRDLQPSPTMAEAASNERTNLHPPGTEAHPVPETSEPDHSTDRGKKPPEPTSQISLETAEAIRAALAPRKRSRRSVEEPEEAPEPSQGRLWTAGSIVMLVLLIGQLVHHYRNDLAASATLNGPLTAVYSSLGIPLVPRWDVGAYEVRQLGASTAADAPGQITVRASVKNGAHQSQPLPLLRVTLQDRFGNRIAARDVPPQSYLPRAIPRSAQLSAGQRIDAEMAFVDPGANAVGFEIDACLPAPGGGVACANDTAR